MYIFTPGMAIRKRTDLFAKINAGGAVVNFLMNMVLIPHIGIQGAALATFISYMVVFSMYFFWSQQLYYVPHRWRAFIYILVFSGGVVFFEKLFDLSGFRNIFFNSSAIIIVIFSFFSLRVLNISELKKSLRK
jgi:O-antigen/teichoic acid export membrane protein